MRKDESWGKSIQVDNVQVLANSSADIPEIYIRPDLDIGAGKISDEKLPIIDMSLLLNSNFSFEECSKLDLACKQWGFFQVCACLYIYICMHIYISCMYIYI